MKEVRSTLPLLLNVITANLSLKHNTYNFDYHCYLTIQLPSEANTHQMRLLASGINPELLDPIEDDEMPEDPNLVPSSRGVADYVVKHRGRRCVTPM
jgi:hypothetical protein